MNRVINSSPCRRAEFQQPLFGATDTSAALVHENCLVSNSPRVPSCFCWATQRRVPMHITWPAKEEAFASRRSCAWHHSAQTPSRNRSRSGWVTAPALGPPPSNRPAWVTYLEFTPYPEHRETPQQPRSRDSVSRNWIFSSQLTALTAGAFPLVLLLGSTTCSLALILSPELMKQDAALDFASARSKAVVCY